MAETLTQTPQADPSATLDGLPAPPDIDQLLNDAESLAQEIADAVTLDADAAARAEAVRPVGVTEVPVPVAEPASEPLVVETPSAGEVTASISNETPAELPTDEPEPAASAFEEPAPTVEQGTSDQPVADEPPQAEASNVAEPDETVPADVEASPKETVAAIEAEPRPIGKRLAGVVVWAAMLPVRILLGAAAIIDLPFSGLSAATKNRIGMVGIATLIMAAAAYFLPGLLISNPYVHITDFPPAAIEEGHEGGGGGDHAKPAAAGHEKPAAEKPKAGH